MSELNLHEPTNLKPGRLAVSVMRMNEGGQWEGAEEDGSVMFFELHEAGTVEEVCAALGGAGFVPLDLFGERN